MDKFSLETNGYNREEVNLFISDVIKETERIINRIKKQNLEIDQLKKELEHYKKMESTLNNAINYYEETSKNLKDLAEEESNIIIEKAKNNASRIVNEALTRAEQIEKNSELLEKNIQVFKKKLKLIIEQQLKVADEIELLELEDK